MTLTKSTCLKFYKQKEVQEAIVQHAQNKEIGVQYGLGNFGKRPDVLTYPRDVLELALNNVTSLHASEELWSNPLNLNSSLSKEDLEDLRIGWDLVLDIDCKDWEFSKLTTHLFIKALKDNSVKNISCKFSGNKGFHIGVPFQAFPTEFSGKKTKDLFPAGPQKIAQFLLNEISEKYVTVKDNEVIFDKDYIFPLTKLKEKFGDKEFILTRCKNCLTKINFHKEALNEFICPRCDANIKSEKNYVKCEKCNELMVRIEHHKNLCGCGSNEYFSTFDPLSLIEVDTVLISSRHLYRMPYSLHEKSGLVSLPIDPTTVLDFDKSQARPENITFPLRPFIDRQILGESAGRLLLQAWDFQIKTPEIEKEKKPEYEEMKITCPITAEFFPPCIQLILNGVDDGKKRSVFIVMNFLGKLGWSKSDIETFLYKWNQEKNREPLREVYIKGQLNHFQSGKLPPNCSNDAYYPSIGVCKPDALCAKIKNPVNYALWKWKKHLWMKEEQETAPKREPKKEPKIRPKKKTEPKPSASDGFPQPLKSDI